MSSWSGGSDHFWRDHPTPQYNEVTPNPWEPAIMRLHTCVHVTKARRIQDTEPKQGCFEPVEALGGRLKEGKNPRDIQRMPLPFSALLANQLSAVKSPGSIASSNTNKSNPSERSCASPMAGPSTRTNIDLRAAHGQT